MRQTGTVISADTQHAQVSVQRMSACDGCHKANPGMGDGTVSSVCHECSMFSVDEAIVVTAVNDIGAVQGDRVILESSSQMILGYAAAVFLLPLLLAAILGCLFALFFPKVWGAYLGAVIGFIGAFLLIKMFLDRHAKEKTVYTIIKILSKNNEGIGTSNEYEQRTTETMEY